MTRLLAVVSLAFGVLILIAFFALVWFFTA